ncbi:MAG TPA: hypothetical protein VKS79_07720 [Gemmataceae bacterium]|nr:hypothetical protein [Gemmataceae bacterium]
MGRQFCLVLSVSVFCCLDCLPAFADDVEATKSVNCTHSQRNLQDITLAMGKYYEDFGNFPPVAYYSKDDAPDKG